MANMSTVQADLADGTITRIYGMRVIDGIAGWALAVDAQGKHWAYAPEWYTISYGEICREI